MVSTVRIIFADANSDGIPVVAASKCPVVLVSAGIGMTPMVSMLHAPAAEGSERPVWFIHGARVMAVTTRWLVKFASW